jgi:hypothetical protein
MNIFIEPVFSDIYNKYPIVLIDVGASGGLERNWLPAVKYLQTIGFEPDERAYFTAGSQFRSNPPLAPTSIKTIGYLL